MHVALFPYLWIRGRRALGGYELIPRNDLRGTDFKHGWIKAQTEGLLQMYELRGSMANRFGTIARRRDGYVGDLFARDDMRPLRRAVMTALLDRNPTNIGVRRDSDGWHVSTSDHALLYVHQLDGSGHVAVQYGRLVEVMVGGLRIGDQNSVVHAPAEIHTSFLAPDPDELYADALYDELTGVTAGARRLGRSIDWLDVMWRNTPSIDDDTRILATFSGFEVLLNEDGAQEQGARTLGRKLSELLEPGAAKKWRPIRSRRREISSTEMTDLEWWFAFFAFLRNDIAHGNTIEPRQYEWSDQSHLFIGEARLRQAIKQVVANAGHPEVTLDPFERIALRYGREIISDE